MPRRPSLEAEPLPAEPLDRVNKLLDGVVKRNMRILKMGQQSQAAFAAKMALVHEERELLGILERPASIQEVMDLHFDYSMKRVDIGLDYGKHERT